MDLSLNLTIANIMPSLSRFFLVVSNIPCPDVLDVKVLEVFNIRIFRNQVVPLQKYSYYDFWTFTVYDYVPSSNLFSLLLFQTIDLLDLFYYVQLNTTGYGNKHFCGPEFGHSSTG